MPRSAAHRVNAWVATARPTARRTRKTAPRGSAVIATATPTAVYNPRRLVQVPPPASHGASATAAFNRAVETGAPHNGRRVKIDYSQSATPHEKGRGIRQNTNDGTRDIGNAQVPILLFRGLDPLSGPQAILQAMKSSSGVGKEGAKGMKRIILIKDKVTMASFCFAFVEFVDVQVMD